MPVLDEDFVSKPEEVIRNSEDIGDLVNIISFENFLLVFPLVSLDCSMCFIYFLDKPV